MGTARLLVAYDGAAFHGFAPNDGVDTVAGLLADALGKVTRIPVELTGAGRTDAGVHGWGQVVSLELPDDTDLANLAHRVNRMIGTKGVAVREARWAPPGFNARFDAVWRHYRYHVLTSEAPNPLIARTVWHVGRPLDLWAMQLACDPLIGEHDFSSFCRRPKVAADQPQPSMIRRVLSTRWTEVEPDLLRFEIRATAFCHQMVRSIVGTLVDVGLGRRSAGEMMATLRAKDRAAAGPVAPPQGLVLWEVGYPDDAALQGPLVVARRGSLT